MRTTKKRMHGRRRRRSPLQAGQISEHEGKPVFKTAEEALEWHKKNSSDESPQGATNKNATTAASEASEKGVKNKTGSVQTEPNHDTTHSHPATALEGNKQEEEKEMSSRDRARGVVQNLGGSWGKRTFGF
jgi:hypothetical protein